VVVVMRSRSGVAGSGQRGNHPTPPHSVAWLGRAGPPTPRWQPAAQPTSPLRSRVLVLEAEGLGVQDTGDLFDHLADPLGLLGV
jgi:hypothetical protein